MSQNSLKHPRFAGLQILRYYKSNYSQSLEKIIMLSKIIFLKELFNSKTRSITMLILLSRNQSLSVFPIISKNVIKFSLSSCAAAKLPRSVTAAILGTKFSQRFSCTNLHKIQRQLFFLASFFNSLMLILFNIQVILKNSKCCIY